MYLKIIVFLIFAQALSISSIHSQNTTNRLSAIILEAGGTGGIGSISFDQSFPLTNHFHLGYSAGFSVHRIYDFYLNFNPNIVLPYKLNLSYGHRHKVELSVGPVVTNSASLNDDFSVGRKTDLHGSFSIGYRFQSDQNKFNWRAGYSPIWQYYKIFKHWAGVSFGYTF